MYQYSTWRTRTFSLPIDPKTYQINDDILQQEIKHCEVQHIYQHIHPQYPILIITVTYRPPFSPQHTRKTASHYKQYNRDDGEPYLIPQKYKSHTNTSTQENCTILYDKLCQWRSQRSKSEKRPPYTILSNALCQQIAQRQPKSLNELQLIKGIGPSKSKHYGRPILNLIKHHQQQHNIYSDQEDSLHSQLNTNHTIDSATDNTTTDAQ
jgi:superfamily II DNA helicase RecQ